jgi:hypothetical protein
MPLNWTSPLSNRQWWYYFFFDGMYVQVSAAPLTGCLAVYAEVPERAVRVC